MHNPNIRARPKVRKPKKSSFSKHEEKITIILSLIKARETVSEFDIRHALKLSYTKSYQLITDLQHNYQEYVSWNKKERTFTHLKEFVKEEEIEIKDNITEHDYKIMDAIRQEVIQK